MTRFAWVMDRSKRDCLGFPGLVLLLVASFATSATGLEYYVATNGSDANAGSLSEPFASLGRAQQAAAPGDTVWIRGGVYEFAGGADAPPAGVTFDKSGTAAAPIKYWAYPQETPVFDFYNYKPNARSDGFSVQGDYLHFKGFELRGVQQQITSAGAGIRIEGGGSHNTFEQLNLHHNQGLGLWIDDGGHNLVLNSDSHHNYDPIKGGGDADGFGTRTDKPGNRFVGSRAWNNSDDGFDIIFTQEVTVIENSWAWHNGYIPGTDTPAGNGAGFKSGGYTLDVGRFPAQGDVPRHVIRGNLAFDNRVQGFYANHHPGGLDFLNNTAFDNPRGFDLLNDVQVQNWPADHFLRNNISFGNSQNLANARQELIDDEFNNWNPGFSTSTTDFVSLSPIGVDGPRQADGSLPEIDFLQLAEGSSLIDAGANVGLPFTGWAPDLGAFETDGITLTPGDIDGDGDADIEDLRIIAENFRKSGGRRSGDLTGDNFVDLADFREWKTYYPDAFAPEDFWFEPAPEPGSAAILAWAMLQLVGRSMRGSP